MLAGLVQPGLLGSEPSSNLRTVSIVAPTSVASRGRLHSPPARRFAARRGRRGCAGACDSALDRHVVESVAVPCSGPGVVAVHEGGFFHESPPLRGASCGSPGRCRPPRPGRSRPTGDRRRPAFAQLAKQDRALSALFAWTVVSEPPCPVLRACNRSAASPPPHFADDDVIGPVAQGVAHEVADRDRCSSSGPRAGRGAFPQGYIQMGAAPPRRRVALFSPKPP